MKTILIIILILLILFLLYYFFFRKKKAGTDVKAESAESEQIADRSIPSDSDEAAKNLKPVCLDEKSIDIGEKYKRIIAINLEAPNTENDRICEYAMVYDDNGKKYSAVNLVDPETAINHEATRALIEKAGKCPTFPELWKELYSLFDGSLVIAHNTAFDVSVLKKTIAAYGLAFPKFDVACTYRMSKKYHPELDNFKLGTVCKFYDIPLDAEDAVSHGNACYEIFRKLISEGVSISEEAKEFSL